MQLYILSTVRQSRLAEAHHTSDRERLCAREVTPGPEQKQQVPNENAQLLGWASKQCLEPLRVRQSHMAKGLGGRCQRLPTAHTLADSTECQAPGLAPAAIFPEVPKPSSSLLTRVKGFSGLVWHLRCCEGQSLACSLLVADQQVCRELAAAEESACRSGEHWALHPPAGDWNRSV